MITYESNVSRPCEPENACVYSTFLFNRSKADFGDRDKKALYAAGEAVGWDQAKVDAVIQARSSSVGGGQPAQKGTIGEKETEPPVPDKAGSGRWVAMVIVLLLARGGWSNYDQQQQQAARKAIAASQQEAADRSEQVRMASVAAAKKAAEDKAKQAARSQPGQTFKDCDVCPEMVVIPAGSFRMGSNELKREQPTHMVTMAKPFALGKTEVTFAEFDAFTKATGRALPSDKDWGRGMRPVINVNWDDATAYAKWLSSKTGKR